MHTSFKLDDDMDERIGLVTDGSETISQFAKKATTERLKRMEARDIRAIKQRKEKEQKEIEPIIVDILKKHGLM